MEIIVVNKKLNQKETKNILQRIKQNINLKIHTESELPKELMKYSSNLIELTANEKKDINYRILEKIVDFGEKEIKGKKITDMLTFETASIWHYHKFRTYFYIRNIFYEIEILKKYSERFKHITYYGSIPKQLVPDNITIIPYLANRKFSAIKLTVLLKYGVFFAIRLLISLRDNIKLTNKKHLILDSSIKQNMLNISTLKEYSGNYYLEYLIDKADHDFIVLDDISIPKLTDNSFQIRFSYFRKDKNRIFSEPILFRGLVSKQIRKKLAEYSKLLMFQYKKIRNDKLSNTDLLIIDYLSSLHKTSKLFLFKFLSYQLFFQKYNFSTITSVDENSPKIKSIFDAAKSRHIKTIGIQHGTIHKLHPAYIFTKEDRKRRVMSDYTMIWGEYWKKLLIEKGNYDKDSLIITGQIRTDIIPVLQKQKLKREINESFPKNKKLIIFASQPQRDKKLRKQAALDVFHAISRLPETFLIVKLHPAEMDGVSYYKNIAKKVNCTNFTILINVDLYLLISISDIVITCFSTVGAETVYFNKPLIILDHLKQDIQNYHKEGIAFQTTNSAELKSTISKLISGEIKNSDVAYAHFISKYANRIDGKVSERIVRFIKRFV